MRAVQLAVVDLRTRRSRGLTPRGRDVPSGNAYVVGIPEIYVVNADGTGLRRLTRNRATDESPTWTPDGRIVFASDFASEGAGPERLYVMNADGTGLRRFAAGSDGDDG